jgi:hypothetical protein
MRTIATAAEAEQAIDDVTSLIEKISTLMEQEMALVHAGRVRTATELGPVKSQLAGELHASGEWLKGNAKFLMQAAPARCAILQRVQESFRAVLQKNLVVLATTHAVAEGIVRRLSSDLARKTAPQLYGASGRTTAPNPRYGQPLAVSRRL